MSDYLVSLARRAKFGERNASRKLAMIALCNAASDGGEAVGMAAAEIAEAAELASVKNAMRVRKELVMIGLIEPVRVDGEAEPGHGQGAKGWYRINVKRLEALFHGEWDFGAEAEQIRRPGPPGEPASSGNAPRVPLQHPTGGETRGSHFRRKTPGDMGAAQGAAKGAAKGSWKGVSLGTAPPQTPLVGEVYNLSPPLTPPTRRSEREGERGFAEILQELHNAKPTLRRVIDVLIDPLLRLRRFEAPDPVFALGAVAERAQEHADDVLQDAVKRVLVARGALVKASDLDRALADAIAHAKLIRPNRDVTTRGISTNPDIIAKVGQLREALIRRLGDDVFAGWFGDVDFDGGEENRVVAWVGAKFVKAHIERHFSVEMDACVREAFPEAQRLEIVVRPVGRLLQ